jgi:hypothetical protein
MKSPPKNLLSKMHNLYDIIIILVVVISSVLTINAHAVDLDKDHR